MAAEPETPLSALLGAVDSTILAVLAVLATIAGSLRWVWNLRAIDLERMTKMEVENAQQKRDIETLQTDHKQLLSELSRKPDRAEMFDRIDRLPHQIAAMLGHRIDNRP